MFVLQLPVEVSDNTHVVKVHCPLMYCSVVFAQCKIILQLRETEI